MNSPAYSDFSDGEPSSLASSPLYSQSLNKLLATINRDTLIHPNGPFYEELERQRRSMRYYRYFFLVIASLILILLTVCVVLVIMGNIEVKAVYDRTRTRIMGGTSF